MKQGGNDSGDSNTNRGDNQNKMDSLAAGGDIEQTNEIHQHYHQSEGATTIPDPNALNSWIDLVKWVANLPISESKILAATAGTGSLGIITILGLTTPWNGLSANQSQYGFLIPLIFVSSICLAFTIAYLQTRRRSRCPNCNKQLVFRPADVRKTDRTIRENGPDIIHGERDMKCENCGFEETQLKTWSSEEFNNLYLA